MTDALEKNVLEENPVETVPGATLKDRLAAHLGAQRRPGDMIRISQVGKRFFRVNWLSPITLEASESVLRTHRITRSRFLEVEDTGGELIVTDRTRD